MNRLVAPLVAIVVSCNSAPDHPHDPEAAVASPVEATRDGFRVPTPIVSDAPGRWVMRRRETSTFFTSRGFAIAAEGRWGIHATLLGASAVEPVGVREQQGKIHRFVGERSQQNLPTYGALDWRGIHPGIDMVVEPSSSGFSYRFELAPGAQINRIAMEWSGGTAVHAVDGGRGLEIETPIGRLHVSGLRAYALEGRRRHELPARFDVHGSTVSFAVDGWSGDVPLVIDPSVGWSSFVGGSGADAAYGVAVDSGGSIVIVGTTDSSDYPTTGGFDTTAGAAGDACVAKLTPSGALSWGTYLAGSAVDSASAIAIDKNDDVLVVGTTRSVDFPVAGAFGKGKQGGWDAFVTKLSKSGALVWSTHLGGNDRQDAQGVVADGSGNVYVTGYTSSVDFPTTGGFDTTLGGTQDAYVAKFDAAGALLWSSYLGGSLHVSGSGANDYGSAIAADASGNVFVTGETNSTDFPTTGGFDTTLGAGFSNDAFVTKVSPAGKIVWSTYLGGSTDDDGRAIAVAPSGDVIVAGSSDSIDFPNPSGAVKTYGRGDIFVSKLANSGALVWSTFFGSSQFEYGNGVATDASGAIYVTGTTFAADFPNVGAFGATYKGGGDAFVTKLGGGGSLLWSSYLSGSAEDWGGAIATSKTGDIAVTGHTKSADFPVSGGFDTALGGSNDAFVFLKLAATANGTPCTSGSDCASVHCTDGVCCDTACGGGCEACSIAKGAAVDGTCSFVAADTDPKNACSNDVDPCGADGNCDGAGKCRSFAKAGTPCGATTCSTAGLISYACTGDSPACSTVTTSCGLYACDAMACKTACVVDGDCSSEAWCSSGACVARKAAGASCGEARECASNFCVDGVCCNSACAGQCEACDASGTCVPVSGAPRGTRAPCAGGGTACAGSCDGKNGGSCRFPIDAECSRSCVAAHETIGKCDENGACLVRAATSCGGFTCGGDRCRTTCANDDDCALKYRCTSGACTPAIQRCSDDGLSVVAIDRSITSCGVTRCRDGACLEACSSSADCAGGTVCESSVCVAPPPGDTSTGGCRYVDRRSGNEPALLFVALLAALRRRSSARRSS